MIRSKNTGSPFRQDSLRNNLFEFVVMAFMESETLDSLGNAGMDIANIAQMSAMILGLLYRGSLQSLWSLVNTM